MIFAFGAVVGRLGLGPAGGGWPAFAAGAAAFAIATASMRLVSVVLLGLFVLTTILAGLESRTSPAVVAWFAAGDLALALALTQRQAEAAVWSLPAAGRWEEGAILAAVAAVARLAGPGYRRPTGLALVGWWQGIFLLWWVGAAAGPLLAAAGVALILIGGWPRRGRRPALLLAGGVAALLASVGSEPGVLLAVGLAGCALVLGEAAISAVILGGLPASVVWNGIAPDLPLRTLVAVAAPLLFLLLAHHLAASGPPGWGGRLAAGVAGAGSVWVSSGNPSMLAWTLYGVGGAGLFTILVTKPGPVGDVPRESAVEDPAPPEVAVAAWILLASALAVWARLVVIGVGTGFL